MSQLVITQQTINEVHERLQYDDDFDCVYLKGVPLTAAGLLASVNHLGPLYQKEPTLVVLSWSAAEALIKESIDVLSRNWNLNLAKDRKELAALQVFKTRHGNLFEAGYVGDLDGRVPVVASIQASPGYAIVTVAPGPLQIENEKGMPHNSVLVHWSVPLPVSPGVAPHLGPLTDEIWSKPTSSMTPNSALEELQDLLTLTKFRGAGLSKEDALKAQALVRDETEALQARIV